MSLLEDAKNVQLKRRRGVNEWDKEDIELICAFINGNISLIQATTAFNAKYPKIKTSGGNLYSYVASMVRAGVRNGWCNLKFKR